MSDPMCTIHFKDKNSLIHYGVQGQKWGVRRYQNEDNSLTEEGRRHYGIGDVRAKGDAAIAARQQMYKIRKTNSKSSDAYRNAEAKADFAKKNYERAKILDALSKETRKSLYRQKLEERYRQQGLSAEDAAVKAYQHAQTVKKVAVITAAAAAVTIASIGAVKAYKNHVQVGDQFLKKNGIVQSITTDANKGTDKAFFASYKKVDNEKYIGRMGHDLANDGAKNIYKMEAATNARMKLAGSKNATKIINEEMQKDSVFRQKVADSLKEHGVGDLASKIESGKGITSKEDYHAVNRMLGFHDEKQQAVNDHIFDLFRKKGYGGMVDMNDKFLSGYGTKSPSILFDSSKLNKIKVSQLSSEQIQQAYNKYKPGMNFAKTAKKLAVKKFFTRYLPLAGIGTTLGLASNAKERNNRITEAQKDAIKEYKKLHPRTKMNDREILESVYGLG